MSDFVIKDQYRNLEAQSHFLDSKIRKSNEMKRLHKHPFLFVVLPSVKTSQSETIPTLKEKSDGKENVDHHNYMGSANMFSGECFVFFPLEFLIRCWHEMGYYHIR